MANFGYLQGQDSRNKSEKRIQRSYGHSCTADHRIVNRTSGKAFLFSIPSSQQSLQEQQAADGDHKRFCRRRVSFGRTDAHPSACTDVLRR